MGSFSWKLARKWTWGVLLEIRMFSYTSNAAGKRQEVLYWLMQKYVKWWNAAGNWNYFPTTFTLLNAAALPATLYRGQEAQPLCQPPCFGSSMSGLGLGCCSRQGCDCLWSAPPATGAWEIPPHWLCRCCWVRGGWEVSFRNYWLFPKQGGFFIHWEGKLSKPCVYLCGHIK